VKTLCYQPCFVSLNGATSLLFESKNPFAANNISSSRWWNKLPCIILQLGIKFGVHGLSPFWRLDGEGITSGFNQIQVSHSEKSMRKRIPGSAIR